MQAAHEKGTPVIRPLFYDFPEDKTAWNIDDEFMFGPSVLVAPILYENARERSVYLPEGSWTDTNTGKVYEGGCSYTVPAPIEYIPVFVKTVCADIFND